MKRRAANVLIFLVSALTACAMLGLFIYLQLNAEGEGGAAAAALNAGLFLMFCLPHSVLARRRVKNRLMHLVGEKYRLPLYSLFLIVPWIGPVMTYSRLEFAALSTVYILVGVFLEEWNIEEELGEAYRTYQQNVPMLIPRLTAWSAPGHDPFCFR